MREQKLTISNCSSISSQCEVFLKNEESTINNMQPHVKEFRKLETTEVKEPCKEKTTIKLWKSSVKMWNMRKEDIMYNGHGSR